MHASMHAIARSLADAAQAMGFDHMRALADELSARMASSPAAKVEPAPELRTSLPGDFSAASFDASRRAAWFERGEIRHVKPGDRPAPRSFLDVATHLQPGDRLTFKAPSGHPLFTVEVDQPSPEAFGTTDPEERDPLA